MKKIVYICLLTLIINGILYFTVIKNPRCSEQQLGVNLGSLTNEINQDNTVRQEIQPIDNEITEVRIFLSTYNRENLGTTEVQLVDSNGNEVFRYDIDNSQVKDNEYLVLEDVRIHVNREEKYTLNLSSTIVNGGITAWYDEDNQLVCTLGYKDIFDIYDLIQVNAVFLIINIGFISLISYLRK